MSAISPTISRPAADYRIIAPRDRSRVRTQSLTTKWLSCGNRAQQLATAQVRVTCNGLHRTRVVATTCDDAWVVNAIARFPVSRAGSANPQNRKCESPIAGAPDAIYIALHVLHDLHDETRAYAKRSAEGYGCAFGTQAMTHRSNEEWLEIRAAADLAGVSDDTIRRRIRSGELPRAKRGNSPTDPWLIPMGDLVSSGLLTATPGDPPAGPSAHSAPVPPAHRRDALLAHLGALREVHAALGRQIAIVEQLTTGAGS